MDEEAAVQGHVNNSKRVLEEAYQTGTAILGNMAGQRERLKVSAQGKLCLRSHVSWSQRHSNMCA